jgi:hypothetical protein
MLLKLNLGKLPRQKYDAKLWREFLLFDDATASLQASLLAVAISGPAG